MLRGMRRFHLYERMALVRRTMKEAAAAFSKSVNWSSQGRNSTRQPAQHISPCIQLCRQDYGSMMIYLLRETSADKLQQKAIRKSGIKLFKI
jgi:hypothetical protein